MRTLLTIALLTMLACGGSTEPPAAQNDAGAPDALDGASISPDAQPDASPDADGGCWRCADRAWRNVCVVPAERAEDALSCLHCGEHCNSTPDAGAE